MGSFGRLYPALALRAEPASGFDASRFDPGRESCPHCGYIEEACDCDLHQYMGAFDEPHFTGATR
jgi:hypothetical protein